VSEIKYLQKMPPAEVPPSTRQVFEGSTDVSFVGQDIPQSRAPAPLHRKEENNGELVDFLNLPFFFLNQEIDGLAPKYPY